MNLVNGFWSKHVATVDPLRFRASPHYLDQKDYPYPAVVELLAERGVFGRHLVELFGGEDGAFGCETREFPWSVSDPSRGMPWLASRDLLDSALELDFLRRALPERVLAFGDVLDIGAGYGRFAHRATVAFPNLYVYCTDAVQLSAEVCARYLTSRHVKRAKIIAPSQLADRLPMVGVDLAVNIHCWSECTREEISWWLSVLDRHQVHRLFIVPHHAELRAYSPELGGGRGAPYREDLESRGWRETATWSHELEPAHYSKHYYLFQR